jgi:hypothetical protein
VILKEWGLANVADDAEMIVSELVTNALTATWPSPVPSPSCCTCGLITRA